MSHASWLKALALAVSLFGFQGSGTAQAQDWTDYLHWPYVPPQVPANGATRTSLYDRFYVYPREQRIVPQIQGPFYKNYYGGSRHLGLRKNSGVHGLNNQRYYQGYHFALDVF